MGKLILVRHGETEKNVVGSLHAADDPENLNEKGKLQMRKTAQRLAKFLPSMVYSSKEKRALESTHILCEVLGITSRAINGMQERNWGVFTGKSWDEVKKVLDPMTLEERYNYLPQGGESWKEFETRLIKAIKKVLDKDKNVVVVTHGGAIRALMPYLLKVPKEESFKYDPDNASLTIFDYHKNGFKNVVVNDTSHLR